jgi:hypothetical protein
MAFTRLVAGVIIIWSFSKKKEIEVAAFFQDAVAFVPKSIET